MNLSERREYNKQSLTKSGTKADPFEELTQWLNHAYEEKIRDYNAFHLSTADSAGNISGRIVLLKEISASGLVFFTNYGSRKGQQIDDNKKVAATFFWPALDRQIRIEGNIEKLDEAANDVYFRSRPYEAQVATAISMQSKILENRTLLENKFEELVQSGIGIERPKNWGGYLIHAVYFEFWQGRPYRLNDRIAYEKQDNRWKKFRLAP